VYGLSQIQRGVIEMFRRLTDFGHERSLIQAIGFYLVYLIGGIALGALLGALAGMTFKEFGFDAGLMAGAALAVVSCPLLSFAILRAKGLLSNVVYLLIAVLSVAGAAVGGLILGLIFVAFLSTRSAVRRSEPVEAGATFA
jgi:hypothetical protein